MKDDFKRGKIDKILFIKAKTDDFFIIQVYEDDIIFCATNNFLCQKFSMLMSKQFEMSMVGELNFCFRLQIKQCQDYILINEGNYVNELLKKYMLGEVKHVSTPMALNSKSDIDQIGKSVLEKVYRGMIGSLLYLTASRPDIMLSVSYVLIFKVL